jgi:hypothetical protein
VPREKPDLRINATFRRYRLSRLALSLPPRGLYLVCPGPDAILYSASKLWDTECHCPFGHTVPPLAKFCTQCGQPIVHLGSRR